MNYGYLQLEKSAQIDCRDMLQLCITYLYIYLYIFSVLLKFGVHPRNGQRNGQGLTALQQAVFDGNARLAVKLLEVNAFSYHKTSI